VSVEVPEINIVTLLLFDHDFRCTTITFFIRIYTYEINLESNRLAVIALSIIIVDLWPRYIRLNLKFFLFAAEANFCFLVDASNELPDSLEDMNISGIRAESRVLTGEPVFIIVNVIKFFPSIFFFLYGLTFIFHAAPSFAFPRTYSHGVVAIEINFTPIILRALEGVEMLKDFLLRSSLAIKPRVRFNFIHSVAFCWILLKHANN